MTTHAQTPEGLAQMKHDPMEFYSTGQRPGLQNSYGKVEQEAAAEAILFASQAKGKWCGITKKEIQQHMTIMQGWIVNTGLVQLEERGMLIIRREEGDFTVFPTPEFLDPLMKYLKKS